MASSTERKLYDIKAKLSIAKYIIQACLSNDSAKSILQNTGFYELVCKFFSNKLVRKLLANAHNAKHRPKTFLDWHTRMSSDSYDSKDEGSIDKLLRDIIVNHYVVKKCLPNKETFTTMFHEMSGSILTVNEMDTCLKARGFKYKRLPHSKKTIIIEDPEQSFARMKYLHDIQYFRKTNRHIVYIEEKIDNKFGHFIKNLKNISDNFKLFRLAVSSSMGIISRNIVSATSDSTSINKLSSLTNWILDTVVLQLSTPSLIVMEDNTYNQESYEEMPTMYSCKNDMLHWLKLHDIPHSPQMHSAELFELIKRSKCNSSNRRYALDESLLIYGHRVLRCPQRTPYLNYFNVMRDVSESIYNKSFNELFIEVPLDQWGAMEKILEEIELKTLLEDIAVDNTIEKFLLFANCEPISYDEIKDCDEEIDELKFSEIVPYT